MGSKARAGFQASLPLVLLLALTGQAAADVIDGNWCHLDGRHLSIRGPEIVTPGGNRIAGDYSRHSFSYTIPANEPAAGSTVYMILRGEYLMHLRVGEQPTGADPREEWKRCAPTVS
jgi:hypothetical protein